MRRRKKKHANVRLQQFVFVFFLPPHFYHYFCFDFICFCTRNLYIREQRKELSLYSYVFIFILVLEWMSVFFCCSKWKYTEIKSSAWFFFFQFVRFLLLFMTFYDNIKFELFNLNEYVRSKYEFILTNWSYQTTCLKTSATNIRKG